MVYIDKIQHSQVLDLKTEVPLKKSKCSVKPWFNEKTWA